MNKNVFVSALTFAALAFGSASAFAQSRGDDRGPTQKQVVDKQHRAENRADDRRGHDARDHDSRRGNDRHGGRDWNRHDARDHHRHRIEHRTIEHRTIVRHVPPAHSHARGRGAGPRHDLHRGAHLPSHYRSTHYYVEDWRGHRLSAPPRGHRWVQVGADYVLIAVATGVIAHLLLAH